MNNTGLVHDCTELRRLIAENPELPIIVAAGEDANTGDSGWEYCMGVKCAVMTVLDCDTPFGNGCVYDDKDDFMEDLIEYLLYFCSSEFKELSDDEFDKRVNEEAAKYEPYWKKVIAIRADN